MTDKQKIKQLETELADLKLRIAALEARPFLTIPLPVYIPPPNPPWSPYLPYVGDLPGNVGGTTCSAPKT